MDLQDLLRYRRGRKCQRCGQVSIFSKMLAPGTLGEERLFDQMFPKTPGLSFGFFLADGKEVNW